jgi:hypothetical protein
MGFRSRLATAFVVVLALAGIFCVWRVCTLFMGLPSGPAKITVSKETTYVTGPLRPDGSVDFLAALNEHCRAGVTAENNAAIPFWQAAGPSSIRPELRAEFFRLLGIPPLPETGHYLVSFSDHVKSAEKAPPGIEPGSSTWQEQLDQQCEQAQTGPWSREEFPAVARWLDANEKPLEVLAAGLRRPRFYSPLAAKGEGGGSVAQVPVILLVVPAGEATRLLTARALLQAKEGKVEEAWQDLLAAHRLALLVGQGPFIVDSLTASVFAWAVVSGEIALSHHAALTNEQVRRFRADLGGLPPPASAAKALSFGERLYGLDTICALSRPKPAAGEFSEFFDRDALEGTLAPVLADRRVDWDRVLRVVNVRYDEALEGFRMPTLTECRRRLAKLNDDVDRSAAAARAGKPSLLSRLLPPRKSAAEISQEAGDLLFTTVSAAYLTVIESETRTRVHADLRDMAWALAEYRNDRGEYPPALKNLAPKYMPEIPKDPFATVSDADYHYLRRGAGYLLYSVGPDGRDDGGRNRSDDPKKYESESDRSKIPDDIAIRTPEEKP